MVDEQSRDVIQIEIRGEQALHVLQELLATVQRLEVQLQQMGASADAVLGKIVAPLTAIQQSSAQTVAELQMLRQELAGVGTAAAGPERAAAGLGMMGQAARMTRAEIDALIASIQAGLMLPALPTTPIAGYLPAPPPGPAMPMGGYVPGGPPIYVGPTAPIPLAPPPERLLLPERAGPSGFGLEGVAPEAEKVVDVIKKVGDVVDDTKPRVDRYSTSWDRHLFWLLRAMVLYQALNFVFGTVSDAIGQMISNLMVYDDAMARTSYIAEESEARLGDMLSTVTRLGAAYGQMPAEVLPGTVDITRAFKDMEEATIVSETAAKAALMTGVSYAQSVDYLISIMRLWNIEAKDSERILDLLAIGYQKTNIPMNDLYRSMSTLMPTADLLGLSIDELVGYIGALMEITAMEPERFETLMRRLTVTLFEADAARKLLQLGVPVYEPGRPDVRRDVKDILADIAQIYKEIDTSQKAELINLMGGSQAIGGQVAMIKLVLEHWDLVAERVEDVSKAYEEGGQSARLIDEILGAWPGKVDLLRSAWADFLLELGETTGIMESLSRFVGNITEDLQTWAFILQASRKTGIPILDALIMDWLGFTPEEMQTRFRGLPEAPAPGPPALPEGIRIPTEPVPTIDEIIQQYRREQFVVPTPEEIETFQMEHLVDLTTLWITNLDVGRNIIDATALSQDQINKALADSVLMVEALTQGYIAAAEEMQGMALTEEQRAAIAEKVKEWYEDQTIILKEQEGVFRVIQGAQAAMLREAIRNIDAMQMGFQRLRDFTPEWMAQIEPLARYYQQILEAQGYFEEPRQVLLMGENEQFLLLTIGMTYLRLAISDLQEAMEDQTSVLRGHFNIPGGYVVPTPWDYYSATGSQVVGPVNYPPEVLERYYGYQFPTGATGGATYAGIERALGPIPSAWAATIPRSPGWDVGDWAEQLGRAAEMYGLDPRVLAAIMQVESGGVPTAVGAPTQWGRAQGLMQVMPFHEWRLQPGETLQDPWGNIRIGAEILAEAIARYGPDLGIAAYYGGVEEGALTPGGQEYLRLFGAAFGRLFGAQAEGQEIMSVQGMPEVQRVLSATKTTQDTYLATISLGIQNLIQVNRSILVAVQRQMQPQVTVVLSDTGRQVQQGERAAYGRGGAVIGGKPEGYY